MIRRSRSTISRLILGSAIAALSHWATAAPPGPNLTELVRETQKVGRVPGKITMVWWLPEEFWSVSFRQSDQVSAEQQEAFLKAVRPYLLIAAVDGKLGPLGGSEFADKESLQASIQVLDKTGKSYVPLSEDELTDDVKNLSALLRSMFANMLGAMGRGLHLFFFPATTADGSAIAVATKEGTFSVVMGDQSFTWRLPIGSLLPAKVCPVDGERMTGAWKYCPWHGKLLEVADEPAQEEAKP
jgi:hypothetical protein